MAIGTQISDMAEDTTFAADSFVPAISTSLGAGNNYKQGLIGRLNLLTGTTLAAGNLGTFTGAIIADNSSVKTALQSLETEVELRPTSATLAAAAGSSQIGLQPFGAGAVATTAQDKLQRFVCVLDYIPLALHAAILAGTSTTDVTAYIQDLLDDVYAAGRGEVWVPSGRYIVNGTITVPSGVTMFGESVASEYYPASPYGTVAGALFEKQTTGTAGPIIAMVSSSGLRGLYLWHRKLDGATTGVIRMGGTATSDVCYKASVIDVRIYCHAEEDGAYNVTGAAGGTSYGIYFPPSALSAQRYFNTFNNIQITNCDVGIRLNCEANGNTFTGQVRNCKYYIEIDGAGTPAAIQNTFTGMQFAWIGTAPANCRVFVLRGGAVNNVFVGYTTECQGALYHTDDGTCPRNVFIGVANEAIASAVYAGSRDYDYAMPINRGEIGQTFLLDPTRTNDKYFGGRGNKIDLFQNVSGTLPQTNGGSYPQALVAGDADSKIIVTFDDTAFKTTLYPSFYCKLKVFCSAPANGGTHVAETEFLYRATTTVGVGTGSLCVLRCANKGAAIGGLHFIHGKTGGTAFKIGLVGGGTTATVMNFVAVSMEIEGLTYDANAIAFTDFAGFSFASAAATANDVSDAITLLTVADTSI
jgi:hypothetical protein